MKATALPNPNLASLRSSKLALPQPLFDHHPLTRVVYGPGTLARLGELARELGAHRPLLVTDPGLEAAGHPQRALASLHDVDLEPVVFDGVEENPTSSIVEMGVEVARRAGIDFIIAVGGGSSMDAAKGINFLLTNGGRMSDYMGFGKATKPMLPSIGVQTTAGTGSEAQSFALIADEKTHLKMACGDRKAAFRAAILDPEVTVSQPRGVTAVTGIDALSHALESYVCTRHNPLSQAFAREAWRALEQNFDRVMRNPNDLEARGAMQLGANFAGAAIEASMLGACHACANPLTAHYGLTHGIAIGILLPYVIRFNNSAVSALYADLAHDVGLINGDTMAAAEVLAQRIAAFVQTAGLPSRLSDCGISRGILPVLADEAAQQWTGRYNPRPVGEMELLQLYEAAY
ncbi:MAG: iron-containing alcohol dehydrogenase [Gemmataceae bacterium]